MPGEGKDTFPSEFGRYTLVERLATGGMAEVFKAKIRSTHGFEKLLVIKRILPHLAADKTFVAMFVDEAKLTAQLIHPKIVQVTDFGEVGGQYFIALEFVDGFDALALLRTSVNRQVRLPVAIVMFIVIEVLDALDYAHNAKDAEGKPMRLVHRDISPSNVFISHRGDVKLADFGIAHAQDRESKTQAGTLKGKYGYMSPEQVMGAVLDGRSDIFAVAIVLAEMLMGRRLFTAANDLDVLLMVRDGRLERLDRYGGDIAPDLGAILRKGLAKNRDLRYQNAGEFRDALGDLLFKMGFRVRTGDLSALAKDCFDPSEAALARLKEHAKKWETRPPSPHIPSVAAMPAAPPLPPVVAMPVPLPPPPQSPFPGVVGSPPASPFPAIAPPPPASPFPAIAPPPPASPFPAAPAPPPHGRPAPAMADAQRAHSLAAAPFPDVLAEAVAHPPPIPGSASPPVPRAPTAMGTKRLGPSPAGRPPPLPEPIETEDSGILVADSTGNGAVPEPPPDRRGKNYRPTRRMRPVRATPAPEESERPVRRASRASMPAVNPEMMQALEQALAQPLSVVALDRYHDPAEEVAAPGAGPPPLPTGAQEAGAGAGAAGPDSSGDLSMLSPIRVFADLAVAGETGMLRFEQGAVTKNVFLVRGAPESITSNQPGDRFGDYLVARGALKAHDLERVLAHMLQHGSKMGDSLVTLGLMKPLDVFRHLSQSVREKLLQIFTWSEGGFEFLRGALNPQEAFPLGLDSFEILGACIVSLAPEFLQARIQPLGEFRPRAVPDARIKPEAFRLGTVPREVVGALDGRRTVREWLGALSSPADQITFMRTLYLLLETDLARLE